MDEPSIVQRMPWSRGDATIEPLLTREWLVTNGLGGYASGTVGGVPTRRYHGTLIAALPAPFGRMMMLSYLSERVRLPDGALVQIGGEERIGGELDVPTAAVLDEFRLEAGLPVWRYHAGDAVIEKRMVMPYRQNTVLVRYRLLEGPADVVLELQPALHFRGHDAMVDTPDPGSHVWTIAGDRYEVSAGNSLPPLRMQILGEGTSFTHAPQPLELRYRAEQARGYPSTGRLWLPGHFAASLATDHDAVLTASTESWETITALAADEVDAAEHERRRRLVACADPLAHSGFAAELVLAADQFVISPATRAEDAARAHATGDDARTVIAGYHWFTDWGRDTMISLDGLTLRTGRHAEAGYILRTFAHYVRDGLIPNMFPEGENEGLYHTADATLWFFHALARYVETTGDHDTLAQLLPILRDIVEHHLRGTRFGIGVDPSDGLLRQGAPGYQLTWMDAKVDDWVVTPRRGKAVEINALWYNALRLLEGWERSEHGAGAAAADVIAGHAERTHTAFQRRFWYERGRHLYDVVDGEHGDDPACRPNQVFAIALDHPVLDRSRWTEVLGNVRARLLTPVGLRSLAPDHPDYKSHYDGDLRARDAAYHQGTVWGWLIGPMVDAWLRAYPEDRAGARAMLAGFPAHLGEACLGTISEVFDAEPPFTPRGCIAQAWSVAEALRAWIRTA